MNDEDPRLNRMAEIYIQAASCFWYNEARKIEEQVTDPAERWEILVEAMRQIGYPATGPRT